MLLLVVNSLKKAKTVASIYEKTNLQILTFLFSSLSLLGQTNKLPVPTKAFIEKAKYFSDFEEKYFTKYIGKKRRKS